MAVGTAPASVRQPAPSTPKGPSAWPLLVEGDPGRRRPSRPLHRTLAWCAVLVVGSMLLVVAADAHLTQGQVRLARLQQQLTAELGQHRNLEARVASLSEPSKVVAQSQGNGLVPPSHVTDVPQVVTSPSPHPSSSTTPTGLSVPTASGGR